MQSLVKAWSADSSVAGMSGEEDLVMVLKRRQIIVGCIFSHLANYSLIDINSVKEDSVVAED